MYWRLADVSVTLVISFPIKYSYCYLEHRLENYPEMNATGPDWLYAETDSANGLVPTTNWPMFARIGETV